MEVDISRIQELIERPGESLSVELKRWIDPDTTEGKAKIVKTVLALRNHGGGYLVIGFDNATLELDVENIPANIKEKFHLDHIQGLISKFASEPFEISVEFPEREGRIYPVIVIPPGVKTPVSAKSDLHEGGRKIIKADTIYVRSLTANNTPSTTQAKWKDWAKIIDVCFDNREADIGRFLRRHLGGLSPQVIHEFALAILQRPEPEPSIEEILQKYIKESEERYESVVKERDLKLPDHGTWEVGLILGGQIPQHSANKTFLNLLDSNNPDYTGWPVWLDSRGFRDRENHPYVINGTWESLIVNIDTGWVGDQIDFMRLDPKGKFYLRRALEDDIPGNQRVPEPIKVLDFGLPIYRTAEAIAVGIAFGKAMGCDPEKTKLFFAFKWTKLRGRKLVSWANPGRYISPGRSAYQDDVLTFINVPLETPLSTLGDYVNEVVAQLFEIFDGFSLSNNVIEEMTQRLIQRK
ncbi:MAG: ATP-binding protein [Syntrophobacterales bacterium]|jgi:hypothetical protein|nr:ATP-binding protein [Syntrophobacterales bacterium]